MSKKSCFRGRFDRQHNQCVETPWQSEGQHLCHIDESLSRKFRWKKSLLVIFKIVRLFVNALTSYEKHYLLNRDNLTQLIQMQLFQKQKTFSGLFFAFAKSVLTFVYFSKKDKPHS